MSSRVPAGVRPARPIRPLAVLIALGFALALIGRTTGSGWTMVIVSGLVGVAVAGMVWPALLLRRLDIGVDAPSDAVAGRPLEMTLRLGGSRVLLAASCAAGYRRTASHEPLGGPVAVEVPATGSMVGSPPRRGIVDRIRVDLRCAAPLGLSWWRRSRLVHLKRPIEVAPPAEEAGLPSISYGEGGDRHRPDRRSGLDSVRTVRDYVAGDTTKLIHWGLSAKRGELIVKELEDPEGASLAIVLDLSGDPELGEKMASRAAGLCAEALRVGMEVVLCTAEEAGPRSERVASPLAAGRRLARAVAGPPGEAPRGCRVVRLP